MSTQQETSSGVDRVHANRKQLIVCGLADVASVVAATKADALVSVLHPELIPDTPDSIAVENHFKLAIDDIEAPYTGLQHAKNDDIDTLCRFARDWHDRSAANGSAEVSTMVVHCYAGVSRSTAAAFVILCALNPRLDEVAVGTYLRSLSPTAAPNRLIVSLGDDVLQRRGRMTKAVQAMGRANATLPARPVALDTHVKSNPAACVSDPAAA